MEDKFILCTHFPRKLYLSNSNIFFIFQMKPYSTPADMWSLGAILSFYCNREHLFQDVSSVLEWEGGMSESNLDRDQYSAKLRGIVASLLLPIAKRRPTAAMVFEETMKGDRQRF